jgi:hypothetical protein
MVLVVVMAVVAVAVAALWRLGECVHFKASMVRNFTLSTCETLAVPGEQSAYLLCIHLTFWWGFAA